MTVLEKFWAFTNRHLDKKTTSRYFLEDVDRGQLVTFTDKRATVVTEVDGGEDTMVYINYKDVTRLEFFHEAPQDDPLVSTANTLLIQTETKTLVVDCLPYDFQTIDRIGIMAASVDPTPEVTDA